MDIVDRIRAATAEVADRARHVRIEIGSIAPFAEGIPKPNPGHRDESIGGGVRETSAAAFHLTLDAINFGSGWFPTLRKREGMSGYRTIEANLSDHFGRNGHWSATRLASLDAGEVATALGQDPTHELMALYATNLNDLGDRLSSDHAGDFLGPVRAAGTSAVALVDELSQWHCFADAWRYGDLEVPIFKRAQIAAADLDRAGVARFEDLDRLTMFADNLVPHVLRLDGVLRFDPGLTARIERGNLLEPGSPEEVEMRACTIQVGERIAAERPDLCPADIDLALWNRGAAARYKSRPRPRCRTTAY